MKWNNKDLQEYIQAKEYVDTIIVPLLPFHLSKDTEYVKDAFQREVLDAFTHELEKELTGRVMLTPVYNYIKSASKDEEIERINSWVDEIEKQPFTYIFHVTFDSSWKKSEQLLKGTLLWLPGAGNASQTNDLRPVIRSQVEQVSELIKSYWSDKD
ncbi:DUF2487 family protein [Virgibacillus doumboii]|uniref:DUF2487 family protein n=1 Tax=Virgibacillus doumboii TaxID=2697503 RepID=UPI0013E02260|nr:DUF2487 family protein [Virgibacillus doumboii]